MATELKVTRHSIPCPVCGYDLRATPVAQGKRRCPECGQETDSTTRSHLPWVLRQGRGVLRAYMATMFYIHWKPKSFLDELHGPIARRPALRFHRISLCLAVLLATAAVAGAFAGIDHTPPELEPGSYWIVPTFVLTDSWWGLLPLGVGLYLSAALALAAFRRLFAWGAAPGLAQARALRLGLYLSSFAPAQALLLGLAYLVFSWRFLNNRFGDEPDKDLVLAAILLAVIALALFLPTVIALIIRAGRRVLPRIGILLLGLPAALAMTVALVLACFWIAGYGAMAIESMTH